MPRATRNHDSTRRFQPRWRRPIGILRVLNRTSCLISVTVALFLTVLFRAPAPAQSEFFSNHSNTVAQASVTTRPIRMPVVPGDDISFRQLENVRGLSQTRVLQIVQDDQGFMWFGSQYGLNRYDGYTFKVFKHEPGRTNSLSGVFISSLFKDRSGSLWIGCDEFLDKFDPVTETFSHYRIDTRDAQGETVPVTQISQDHTGVLWLSTLRGLFRFDPFTG